MQCADWSRKNLHKFGDADSEAKQAYTVEAANSCK